MHLLSHFLDLKEYHQIVKNDCINGLLNPNLSKIDNTCKSLQQTFKQQSLDTFNTMAVESNLGFERQHVIIDLLSQ